MGSPNTVTYWGKHNLEGVNFLIEDNENLLIPIKVQSKEECPHKGINLDNYINWPKKIFVSTFKDLTEIVMELVEPSLDIDLDRTFLYSENINKYKLEYLLGITNAFPLFISGVYATEKKDNELLRFLAYHKFVRPIIVAGDPFTPIPKGFERMTEKQLKKILKEKYYE